MQSTVCRRMGGLATVAGHIQRRVAEGKWQQMSERGRPPLAADRHKIGCISASFRRWITGQRANAIRSLLYADLGVVGVVIAER